MRCTQKLFEKHILMSLHCLNIKNKANKQFNILKDNGESKYKL